MTEPQRAEVTIDLMGRACTVPAGLTMMKAAEYAGYRYVRGAGCRAGFCGACATLYRLPGDYKLHTALACQTEVIEGMSLGMLPFVPAHRHPTDLTEEGSENGVLLASVYPELARCVACNTCTKACPQGLEVMDYVQLALRDDLAGVTRESFDCIHCGLCAARCPADIVQEHVAQLARRLHGRWRVAPSHHVSQRVAEVAAGEHLPALEELLGLPLAELKQRYDAREIE